MAVSAASAAANIAARSPETPIPPLTLSATAGNSRAAPIAVLDLAAGVDHAADEALVVVGHPAAGGTVAPNAVPAVPKPTNVTAASSGL